jgi:hypothetical protein
MVMHLSFAQGLSTNLRRNGADPQQRRRDEKVARDAASRHGRDLSDAKPATEQTS